MNNVLLTGANGFIGSHLLNVLVSKGISIRAFILPGTQLKNINNHIAGYAARLENQRQQRVGHAEGETEYRDRRAGGDQGAGIGGAVLVHSRILTQGNRACMRRSRHENRFLAVDSRLILRLVQTDRFDG